MLQKNKPNTLVLALTIAGLLNAPLAVAQSSDGGAAKKRPAATKSNAGALRGNSQVTVNFVNADIDAVTRAMGAMLDRQFVVDPRVKGQITVYSEQAMPVREAYLNYLAALRGLGFTVVESAGLLKVVPEADAKLQTGTVEAVGGRYRGDQVITQIFKLNHENPNNLVPVLRPLISPNNTINANVSAQSLVITDYADNLARIGKIIAALDNPSSGDLEIMPLKHAVALDLAPLVQRLADGTGGGGVAVAAGGQPQGGVGGGASAGVSVLADPRSNALIIRATTGAKLAHVRSIVERLDRPAQGSGVNGNIWVVYLKNADAVRLATVLRAAFANPSQQGGGATGGAPAPTTPAPQANTSTGSTGSGSGSSIATQPLQGAAGVQTGGYIQADPATNSLIITAAEPLYRQIRSVIDQLDARRAQVVVESMIVKIDATKALDLGVQWQGVLGNPTGGKTLLGAGTNYSSGGNNIVNQGAAVAGVLDANGNIRADASATDLTPPGAGLNLGLIRKFGSVYTLASLARFLESNAGANVLSTPTIVALDNEEAQIVIGQNVPFITGSFTNTGAAGTAGLNPFQTIERKDVGLTLRVKPQIGEGGTIRMSVYQENSSVVPGATTSAGPTTDKSAIATSVVVDDGTVMVLGGLLKDEYTDGDDKVPGLGDIPIAGNLFKAQNRKRVKTNLMVFLRPVVIRDSAASQSVTVDRYDAIRSQQRSFAPNPGVGEAHDGPLLPPIQQPNIVPPGTVLPPAGGSSSPAGSVPAARTGQAPKQETPTEPVKTSALDVLGAFKRREIGISVSP